MNNHTYTLTIDTRQKELIVKALEAYGQYHLGQRLDEQSIAKKLAPRLRKLAKNFKEIALTVTL
jgi:hypothetical protein